jgi:hypothetical protein
VPATAAASPNLLDRIAVLRREGQEGSLFAGLRSIDPVSMDIRDLVRLRKAKDRMDRECDRRLDVPATCAVGRDVDGPLLPQVQGCIRRAPIQLPHDPPDRAGQSPAQARRHVGHRRVLRRRLSMRAGQTVQDVFRLRPERQAPEEGGKKDY